MKGGVDDADDVPVFFLALAMLSFVTTKQE
jgi:hypothetical protein